MPALLEEIDNRWRKLFQRLREGDDAPPAMRLRIEGMMEAATIAGSVSEEQLQSAMAIAYRDVFQRDLDLDCGVDWRECYPFPQVPGMAERAPVYPSTSLVDND